MDSYLLYVAILAAAVIVAGALNDLATRIEKAVSTEVQSLVDEVAAVKTVAASALTLINGLLAKIDAAGDDPAAIKQAVQDLKDAAQPLSDAVAANP